MKTLYRLAFLFVITTGLLTACNNNSSNDSDNTAADTGSSMTDNSTANTSQNNGGQDDNADPRIVSNNPHILFATNKGDIVIELFENEAPISAANFIKYADEGFYEGTIFHRVISSFVIQGGGFSRDLVRKQTNPAIQNEANNGLKNSRGTLSMARTSDPHSATSQFFINVEDNAALDFSAETRSGWGYAVFGRVVDGMDVVDVIRAVPTTFKNGMSDVPVDSVSVDRVSVLQR